jgi:hypothetical protein
MTGPEVERWLAECISEGWRRTGRKPLNVRIARADFEAWVAHLEAEKMLLPYRPGEPRPVRPMFMGVPIIVEENPGGADK